MKAAILNLFFVTLTTTSTAWAGEAAPVCEHLETDAEIHTCLTRYAQTQLAAGGPADLAFQSRLDRSLHRYSLTKEQVRTRPLSESFRIIVEATSQYKSANRSKPCFAYTSRWSDNHRLREIRRVRQQIEEAALFLSEVHAASWGHQVSLLFPIKEVSICSVELSENRSVSFEQRSLRIGLGRTPLSAAELSAAWNSGNPIRSSELSWASILPFSGKVRQLLQRNDPEALLRDKMADNWAVLNPSGGLRTTAMYTVAEAIFKLRERMTVRPTARPGPHQIRDEIAEVLKGPGFDQADHARFESLAQNDRELAGLYNLWQQKTFSPQNILVVLENAIGERMRKDTNLHLTLRKINAGIAFVNEKNVSVGLEHLMQNAIPVSKFDAQVAELEKAGIEFTRTRTVVSRSGETTTETTTVKTTGIDPSQLSLNADEINGLIAIDLIDNVHIRVQIPQLSAETYRRVTLYQALREYIPASPAAGHLP